MEAQMSHSHTRNAVAALLAACGLALAVAGGASAATRAGGGGVDVVGKPMPAQALALPSRCKVTEFCGYRDANYQAGLYHYAGSDRNLWNDIFENESKQILVARNISSVQNRGRDLPGANDVMMVAATGAKKCLPLGWSIKWLGSWNDIITGYYWTNCYGN
jgi:hypothetical protein